jgi:DNA-binding response OmpR family regulator
MDRSPKILIADDDADTLDAYSHLLRSEGYEVSTVSSAYECLRIAREERPDLILLDVMLPDISGIEVCRQIKADPELGSIFVIHISGIEISTDQQADGLESGADLYLTKPIQYRKLLAQIQALLRIKNDVSSVMLDQQKRELDSLDRLSSVPRASVAAQMFGAPPLRKNLPEIFETLVRLYGDLLDLALEQRTYKVEHNITEHLHAIVDRLGFLNAGPRDVVDIHRAAMKRKAVQTNLLKAQAYIEEGRMRLVELMGYLVSYYRTRSLGASLTGPSEAHPRREE